MDLWKRVLLVIAFCSLAGFALAQSLADVAKQKPQRKATHVYTNDEIPPSPLANEEPKAKSDEDNAQTAANSSDKEKKPKAEGEQTAAKDEDSPELKAMEKDLVDLKQNKAERKQRTEELRDKIAAGGDPYLEKMGDQLLKARELDLETMGQEQAGLEKKIADKREQEKKEREKQQEASGQ